MTAPSAEGIREVQRRLRAEQGPFVPKPVLPVIDEIVATVLSQHTSDINSERAFAQLKSSFPTWDEVADAPADLVADAIRSGGIADQKARRIQQILAAIEEREGRISLDRLNDLDDDAVAAYLESLPGVGPKTAACVLTFAMGRAAFPVDTHVHREAIRLGWIPAKTTADKAHRLLTALIPPGIRYDLHVALITHGRNVCRAQRPRCDACVLRDLCPYPSDRRPAVPDADNRPLRPVSPQGGAPELNLAGRVRRRPAHSDRETPGRAPSAGAESGAAPAPFQPCWVFAGRRSIGGVVTGLAADPAGGRPA